MLIKNFMDRYKADAQTLPLSDIVLTEKIHIKGMERGDKALFIPKTPIVIVRVDEGKYALVSGYCDYVSAIENGDSGILGIIVPDKSRNAFFKRLAKMPESVNTCDLKTPSGWTSPKPEKVAACIDHYHIDGTFGKDIIIDERYEIIDGYAAVVAARRMGIDKVDVISVKRGRRRRAKKHPP